MTQRIKTDLLFQKFNERKTILFIGGIHGNERSGYLALKKFNFLPYLNITIINIPQVNSYGIQNMTRRDANGVDMNRCYGLKNFNRIHRESKRKIRFIERQILKADYVIDFHEAKSGFRSQGNLRSIGNTIITQNNSRQGNYIVSKLNENIPENKKFMVYRGKRSIRYSLRHFCNRNRIKYCLVEVSKSQQIAERESICKQIISHALEWVKTQP